MRDPLDYTEDELRSLSVGDLKRLEAEAASLESLYNTRQLVEKTLINSLYGALANKWFPLFNEAMAQAITGNGRYFIQMLANNIEKTLQGMLKAEKPYIVYGDTDSVYFHIEPFMNMFQTKNPGLTMDEYVDWADAFEKKVIQPTITRTIAEFAEELNAYNTETIGAEREIISDVSVFSAKKKYYARVRDSEGTRYSADDPYIKVMGLDIIKSGTPVWAKKVLKGAIPHILDKSEDELKSWLREIKKDFTAVDPNDIAITSSIARVDQDVNDKGVYFVSKAAIYHNMYIKKHGLDGKYSPIQAGDKCKRIHLLQPNLLGTKLIAFTNEQFINELKGIIDYDTQFEKGFLSALENMTAPLGYNLRKNTVALDGW